MKIINAVSEMKSGESRSKSSSMRTSTIHFFLIATVTSNTCTSVLPLNNRLTISAWRFWKLHDATTSVHYDPLHSHVPHDPAIIRSLQDDSDEPPQLGSSHTILWRRYQTTVSSKATKRTISHTTKILRLLSKLVALDYDGPMISKR